MIPWEHTVQEEFAGPCAAANRPRVPHRDLKSGASIQRVCSRCMMEGGYGMSPSLESVIGTEALRLFEEPGPRASWIAVRGIHEHSVPRTRKQEDLLGYLGCFAGFAHELRKFQVTSSAPVTVGRPTVASGAGFGRGDSGVS